MRAASFVFALLAFVACQPRPDLPKLYPVPPAQLVDETGKFVNLRSMHGSVTVYDFIFTRCSGTCPIMTNNMRALTVKVEKDAPVRFVSISVDPATDTPERLKAWGAKFHAGDGWTFVTGNKPQVDELLRALAASSARREDHSPTVLIGNDASGNWTRTYGLAKASQLVQIINDVMAGKTATTTAETSN